MIINAGRFSWIIFGSLALGALVGVTLDAVASDGMIELMSTVFRTISTIFLNLIKMVVGPLIFATLTSGIANFGDGKSVLRVGAKAMIWFLGASVVSLVLGTMMALLLQPGAGLSIPMPTGPTEAPLAAELSAEDVITGAFPTSVVNSLATNNVLQIVVFSVFAGMGLSSLGERGSVIRTAVAQLAELMLKITTYVMLFAPLGVFAAVAGTVAKQGAGVFGAVAWLIAGYYIALGVLILVLLAIGWFILRDRLPAFLQGLREPAAIAFSTSSSEAAYPRLLAALERFGVPPRIVSFILPLGYSFNLDASMTYCTFASIFIAQAYGIELPLGMIVSMMLMLMLASKGIAAVPRGSLIALAATLPQFGLPDEGILLLLGVDHLLNMGRSGTNVLGNAVAVVAVAAWEGNERTAEDEVEQNPVASPV
ncbi:dicarboxylate/amino acid:cation symporter [Hyphococcus sp. DH-69]|uniref:dicarboxylate/amino acid:cation symporter n=1 Tax=Hyphococcus formosus TaxID=3143534 RepID=UPI00398AADF3